MARISSGRHELCGWSLTGTGSHKPFSMTRLASCLLARRRPSRFGPNERRCVHSWRPVSSECPYLIRHARYTRNRASPTVLSIASLRRSMHQISRNLQSSPPRLAVTTRGSASSPPSFHSPQFSDARPMTSDQAFLPRTGKACGDEICAETDLLPPTYSSSTSGVDRIFCCGIGPQG
jgi:hypothetical protein